MISDYDAQNYSLKMTMQRIFIFFIFMVHSLIVYGQDGAPLTLSLKEAILLAMRENPNVQRAQLSQLQQKFALEVAKWQFRPHFAFNAAAGINRTVVGDEFVTATGLGFQPEVILQTPIGTQLTLASSNNIHNHFRPGLSLQVMQPLMKGFGRAIVETALYNAIDTEIISHLTLENTMRTTVTAVIDAYLNVVTAENLVNIDVESLNRAETSFQQTKLFIKAGRKAGVELVTVEADVANAKTKLENDKNRLDQERYALLSAIGIDPNVKMKFSNINVPELIQNYSIPSLEETKQLTLENDIQYQIDQITIQGATKRSLLVAEDNDRWQLNLSATGALGSGQTDKSIINIANVSQGVQLNLNIPIDNKQAKQAIANARIALKQARIALQQEKWDKETKAINGWNTIYSTERALKFAEDAERLQQKTYKIAFQKYSHGLIDSVELQSVQQQLITRQQSLLDARIAYLKALVNLDQQIGKTLKTWRVQLC